MPWNVRDQQWVPTPREKRVTRATTQRNAALGEPSAIKVGFSEPQDNFVANRSDALALADVPTSDMAPEVLPLTTDFLARIISLQTAGPKEPPITIASTGMATRSVTTARSRVSTELPNTVTVSRVAERWLRSQPVMEAARPLTSEDATPLCVRRGHEPTSEVVGELSAGATLRVLDRKTLSDGTTRLRVILESRRKPMGWINATLADGSPAVYPVLARPLYEVCTQPLKVRKHLALDSEFVTQLHVGARVHVVEMRKIISKSGAERALVSMAGEDVPIGWITARKAAQAGAGWIRLLSHGDTAQPAADAARPVRRPTRSAAGHQLQEVVHACSVRRGYELGSAKVCTLAAGTVVHVVELRRLPDGTQRVCVVLLGGQQPIGWLSRVSSKGAMLRELHGPRAPSADAHPPADAQPRDASPPPQRESGAASAPDVGILPAPSTSPSPPRRPPVPGMWLFGDLSRLKALQENQQLPAGAESPSRGLPSPDRGYFLSTPTPSSRGKNGQKSARKHRSKTPRTPKDKSPAAADASGVPAAPAAGGAAAAATPAAAAAAAPAPKKGFGLGLAALKKGVGKMILTAKIAQAFAPTIDAAYLEKAVVEFEGKAAAEEAKLDESKKPVSVKLGEALHAMVTKGKKIADLVRSWDPNGDGDISKMEFRQNVRKMLGSKVEVKEVDKMFDELDADKGGSLDLAELRQAFKKLQDKAASAATSAGSVGEQAEFFRRRADLARRSVEPVRAHEKAKKELTKLQDNQSLGARIGSWLFGKQIATVIAKWDKSGDGNLDRAEFRENVQGLGMGASNIECDELFESLDSDGGGELDVSEIRKAFKVLQDEAAQTKEQIKELKAQEADLKKAAKQAQNEWKEAMREDAEAKAEAEAKAKVEAEAAAAAAEAARVAKEAKAAEKKAEEEARQAEFAAKIAAKRK